MGASWQAFYAHLCAASIIRAMPETEIPPAMRGDLYYAVNTYAKLYYPFIGKTLTQYIAMCYHKFNEETK